MDGAPTNTERAPWIVWELTGAGRGPMIEAVRALEAPTVRRRIELVTVGCTGRWPHVTVLWECDRSADVEAWLHRGFHDSFDEHAIWSGSGTLCRHVRGSLSSAARTFRVDRLVTFRPAGGADGSADGDLVLEDAFAPWQRFVVSGAEGFDELATRELVAHRRADLLGRSMSWWAAPPLERHVGI